MHPLIQFQNGLGEYIREGDAAATLCGLLGSEVEDRLLIHRNNSMRAVIDALASSYPAVLRLVGQPYFDALGATYLRNYPPTARTLVGYGENFPDFVAQVESAKALPYLRDIARLDRAFLESSIAADAPALDPAAAAGLPFEDLCALAPGLLPSTRITRLDWSAYSVWTANRDAGGSVPSTIEPLTQIVLFARPGLEVAHAAISPTEAEFLDQIARGATVLAALEAAVAFDPACDPTLLIATAFRTGILREINS